MDEKNTSSAWLKRVEDIINILEGSCIGELELTEGETEIIIRRSPHILLTTVPTVNPSRPVTSGSLESRTPKADNGVPIVAPLTGVYYSATSPTTPPFVNVGDTIHVGQVVALIEAMKVFNEINAEVSGRVTAITATNGNVVQKGDVLIRLEPL
jgi:acetyl-CoA carboxylase biotin carboxyl carrier protein